MGRSTGKTRRGRFVTTGCRMKQFGRANALYKLPPLRTRGWQRSAGNGAGRKQVEWLPAENRAGGSFRKQVSAVRGMPRSWS